MRYAIISDIHSNLIALQAVIEHIERRGIKDIICLGDVIGYGPQPIECIEMIRNITNICLKGNHDEALIEGVCLFHPIAKQAIEWTGKVLRESKIAKESNMLDFISNLPMTYILDNYMFVHASPLDPTMDYILARNLDSEEEKFEEIFQNFNDVLFVGHTHLPCVITESCEAYSLEELDYKYKFNDQKTIVNVGSVGQPRDRDPRACYVEVIDDMFFFHRIEYDNEKVCKIIEDNENLNDALGQRLLQGR